ncbi:MAG: 4Fe-4S binding protein [Candidatus Omnitrophota bacterium]
MKKWVILRKSSQVFFFIFFTYILWSTTYPLRGIFLPETFFKINPLIMIITSISERVILPGIVFAFIMILLTLIFGRFFCGWVCPLGSTIDLTGSLRKKNLPKKDLTNERIRSPKFFILGAIFIASLFGVQIAWVMDPMVIMARFISINLVPSLTGVIEKSFVFAIKRFELYGAAYDVYRFLKSSFLGVKIYYFSHLLIIFLVFLAVVCMGVFVKRAWCRSLCPLGAIYSLVARHSIFKKITKGCIDCKKCKNICRMGAIKEDISYLKGECILCMDCIYDCPPKVTRFTHFWGQGSSKEIKSENKKNGISRQNFILLIGSSLLFLTGFRERNRVFGGELDLIRPPLALREDRFLDRCIRCGNCMKVCITNGLQPSFLGSSIEKMWTPHLVPEIGYCEHQCTLCGNVCPTGAIPRISLEQKKTVRLGIAEVNRSICLPWAHGMECIVCEEHCPIPEKAIKLEEFEINAKMIKRPHVDRSLCVGCGICQNKCPVRPKKAIKVFPKEATRKQ